MKIALKTTAMSAVLAFSAAGAMAQNTGNFPIFEPSAPQASALSRNSPSENVVGNARTPAVEANAQTPPALPVASEANASLKGDKYGPNAAINRNAQLPPEPYAQGRTDESSDRLVGRQG